MCRHVLGTSFSARAIALTPIGVRLRPSRRRMAMARVKAGDRVAIMLEPSRAFYTVVFGTMKLGAIAVPLFTLFGPDGVRLRVNDCSPALLVTNAEKADLLSSIGGPRVVTADADFMTG